MAVHHVVYGKLQHVPNLASIEAVGMDQVRFQQGVSVGVRSSSLQIIGCYT